VDANGQIVFRIEDPERRGPGVATRQWRPKANSLLHRGWMLMRGSQNSEQKPTKLCLRVEGSSSFARADFFTSTLRNYARASGPCGKLTAVNLKFHRTFIFV
jgi:hypothetical protein